MEQYDFQSGEDLSGKVYSEVGAMDTRELAALQSAIQGIKETRKAEQREQQEAWFRQAIIPIFREEAEYLCGIMSVSTGERDNFVITLRSRGGFDIGAEDRRLRLALDFANYISVNADEEESIVILTYDLHTW